MHALALALAFAAAPGLGPTPEADSVAVFSRLGPGEELRVHFRSSGCFNNDVFDFVFRGSPRPTVRVTGVRYGFVRALAKDRAPRSFGVLALSDSEVAGLDSLLRTYRGRLAGNCTTSDAVGVVHVRDGVVVAIEEFVDRSCAADRNPGVTSFWDLIRRAYDQSPGP